MIGNYTANVRKKGQDRGGQGMLTKTNELDHPIYYDESDLKWVGDASSTNYAPDTTQFFVFEMSISPDIGDTGFSGINESATTRLYIGVRADKIVVGAFDQEYETTYVPDGTPTMVAMKFNSVDKVGVYINGSLETTLTVTPTAFTHKMFIGGLSDGTEKCTYATGYTNIQHGGAIRSYSPLTTAP